MAEEKEEEQSEKTEQPSQKKKDKFREEGTFAISKEFGHLAVLISLYYLFNNSLFFFQSFQGIFSYYFSQLEGANFKLELRSVLFKTTGIILIIAIFLIFIYGLQTRFAFTSKKLKWNFKFLNIVSGIFKIFSFKIVIEFIKTFAKVFFLFTAVTLGANEQIQEIFLSTNIHIESFFPIFIKNMKSILKYTILYFTLISGFDFGIILYKHMKKLKMDKKEMKDEHKEQEGDPKIKGKRKEIQKENLKNLIEKVVPKSDFIVTNPEHFAVAIDWQDKKKNPKIAAKGMDLVAQHIKNIASKNSVPIIRSPLLARKLYAELEVGDYINKTHFKAVAKIIMFLKKQEMEGKKIREHTIN
jgi:flagellar biosynthesis protein FlhB